MQLSSAIAAFLREPFAVDTRRRRNRSLQKFLASVGDRPLTDITINDITTFRQSLTVSEGTRYEIMRTIRAFFRWVSKNTDITCLRPERIPVPKIYLKPYGCFSHDEIAKLRQTIEAIPHEWKRLRDKAIFEVMYSTGLRRAELLAIKLCDLDREKRLIHVVGKGNKPAVCYLTQHALDALDAHVARAGITSGLVFTFGANALHERFRIWGQASGLRLCHPHMLRKSFATHMWEAGADIYEVSRLSRHESVETTQRYVIVTEEHDRQVHDMYHGDARRFTLERRKDGKLACKLEVYVAEGFDSTNLQGKLQEIVDSLA